MALRRIIWKGWSSQTLLGGKGIDLRKDNKYKKLPLPVAIYFLTIIIFASTGYAEDRDLRASNPRLLAQMADQAAHAATQTAESEEEYVDLLIDPSISEDTLDDLMVVANGGKSNLYHKIETGTYIRDSTFQEKATVDTGISYTVYKPTANFGNLRLSLIALDQAERTYTYGNGAQGYDDTQKGVRRYTFEQFGFPITEKLAIDNIIGTHRLSSNPLLYRVSSRINQRFGAARPEILGLTSKLRLNGTSLSASFGKLGQSGGSLFPGFEETEGRISRVRLDSFRKRYILTTEYWQTDDFDDKMDNRDGFRVSWDGPLTATIVASSTIAGNEDRQAYLMGLLQHKGDLRHELGAYYFDPEFYWMETRIGNDNRGVYYQLSNRYGAINYGGSTEYREDGLEATTINHSRDTLYLTAHIGYRLNRNSTVFSGYSYRKIKGHDKLQIHGATEEHTGKGNYTLRHNLNTSSHLGLIFTERSGDFQAGNDTTTRGYYSVSRQFHNDSQGSLSLEYTQDEGTDKTVDSYSVDADWQKDFLNGSYLSLGVGYHYSDSKLNGDDQGWSARLLHQWPLTQYLSLSTQFNYNRDIYRSDDEDTIDDGLVTEDPTEDRLDKDYTEGISAEIRLSFNYGGSDSPQILSQYPGKSGSGIIRGRLFIDKNNDGVAQADEPGLAGVTIFLDSIYPIATDSNGEFRFGSVGIGKHHLFIDESSLPLPWTLNGIEYFPVQVKLRRSAVQNFPVRKIL